MYSWKRPIRLYSDLDALSLAVSRMQNMDEFPVLRFSAQNRAQQQALDSWELAQPEIEPEDAKRSVSALCVVAKASAFRIHAEIYAKWYGIEMCVCDTISDVISAVARAQEWTVVVFAAPNEFTDDLATQLTVACNSDGLNGYQEKSLGIMTARDVEAMSWLVTKACIGVPTSDRGVMVSRHHKLAPSAEGYWSCLGREELSTSSLRAAFAAGPADVLVGQVTGSEDRARLGQGDFICGWYQDDSDPRYSGNHKLGFAPRCGFGYGCTSVRPSELIRAVTLPVAHVMLSLCRGVAPQGLFEPEFNMGLAFLDGWATSYSAPYRIKRGQTAELVFFSGLFERGYTVGETIMMVNNMMVWSGIDKAPYLVTGDPLARRVGTIEEPFPLLASKSSESTKVSYQSNYSCELVDASHFESLVDAQFKDDDSDSYVVQTPFHGNPALVVIGENASIEVVHDETQERYQRVLSCYRHLHSLERMGFIPPTAQGLVKNASNSVKLLTRDHVKSQYDMKASRKWRQVCVKTLNEYMAVHEQVIETLIDSSSSEPTDMYLPLWDIESMEMNATICAGCGAPSDVQMVRDPMSFIRRIVGYCRRCGIIFDLPEGDVGPPPVLFPTVLRRGEKYRGEYKCGRDHALVAPTLRYVRRNRVRVEPQIVTVEKHGVHSFELEVPTTIPGVFYFETFELSDFEYRYSRRRVEIT